MARSSDPRLGRVPVNSTISLDDELSLACQGRGQSQHGLHNSQGNCGKVSDLGKRMRAAHVEPSGTLERIQKTAIVSASSSSPSRARCSTTTVRYDPMAVVLNRISELQTFNVQLSKLEEARLDYLQRRRVQLSSQSGTRALIQSPGLDVWITDNAEAGAVDVVEAMRRERAKSRDRVCVAHRTIAEQFSKLRRERARVAEQQADVEQQWKQLWSQQYGCPARLQSGHGVRVSPPPTPNPIAWSPSKGVGQDDEAAEWAALKKERAELDAEREHVRHSAKLADQRVRQAAHFTDELLGVALDAAHGEVLRRDVDAASLQSSRAESSVEARDLYSAEELEVELAIKHEEALLVEKLRTEAFKARDEWEARAALEAQGIAIADARLSEQELALQQSQSRSIFSEAQAQLVARSELFSAAQISQIRNHVERSEELQIAAIREDCRTREAEWLSKAEAAMSKEEAEWASRLATQEAAYEAAFSKMQASSRSICRHVEAAALQTVSTSVQMLEERLAATTQAQSEMRAVQLAFAQVAHQVRSDAAVATRMSAPHQAEASCELVWARKLAEAEAVRDEARSAEADVAERDRKLQQQYKARIGDLIAETARLQKESSELRQERKKIAANLQEETLVAHKSRSAPSAEVELSVTKPQARLSHSFSGAETSVGSRTFLDTMSTSTSSAAAFDVLGLDRNGRTDHDPVCGRSPGGRSWRLLPHQADESILTRCDPSGQSLQQPPFSDPEFSNLSYMPQTLAAGAGSFAESGRRPASRDGHGCVKEIPPVYQAALLTAERNGWLALHPREEPPTWTVLHWAASEDRVDICLRLLSCRADPLVQDDQGRSALECADVAGTGAAWRVLLKAVEERSAATHGSPSRPIPAQVVLEDTRVEAADQLSSAHPPSPGREHPAALPPVYAAAVSAVERFGWSVVHHGEPEWTALHWAASQGRADLCARLLACRASPMYEDNIGRTALDYARESGCMGTLQVLLRAVDLPGVGDAIGPVPLRAVVGEQGQGWPGVDTSEVAASTAAADDFIRGSYPMSLQMQTRL